MAAELDHRCTICLDSMDNASYVMPCLHQFCFGCIRRWAQTRPKCPLCNGRVTSILHSVRPPSPSPQGCSQGVLCPVCINTWDCPSPSAAPCTWPC
uniref:RING-type E3 ubiquitin transferase n=1 Tax=Coturnix japonica TaxID=93934 RepID=A0A8C2YBM4_COTJA